MVKKSLFLYSTSLTLCSLDLIQVEGFHATKPFTTSRPPVADNASGGPRRERRRGAYSSLAAGALSAAAAPFIDAEIMDASDDTTSHRTDDTWSSSSSSSNYWNDDCYRSPSQYDTSSFNYHHSRSSAAPTGTPIVDAEILDDGNTNRDSVRTREYPSSHSVYASGSAAPDSFAYDAWSSGSASSHSSSPSSCGDWDSSSHYLKNWYPVARVSEMPAEAPYKVTLFDDDYAVTMHRHGAAVTALLDTASADTSPVTAKTVPASIDRGMVWLWPGDVPADRPLPRPCPDQAAAFSHAAGYASTTTTSTSTKGTSRDTSTGLSSTTGAVRSANHVRHYSKSPAPTYDSSGFSGDQVRDNSVQNQPDATVRRQQTTVESSRGTAVAPAAKSNTILSLVRRTRFFVAAAAWFAVVKSLSAGPLLRYSWLWWPLLSAATVWLAGKIRSELIVSGNAAEQDGRRYRRTRRVTDIKREVRNFLFSS